MKTVRLVVCAPGLFVVGLESAEIVVPDLRRDKLSVGDEFGGLAGESPFVDFG